MLNKFRKWNPELWVVTTGVSACAATSDVWFLFAVGVVAYAVIAIAAAIITGEQETKP